MKRALTVRLKTYTAIIVSVIALVLGLNEVRLQLAENQYLGQVAQQLRTGSAAGDIQAAVNFVYGTCRLGDGKRGLLRASTLDILDPAIGGQCGEYVRATINLLNQMGYAARRVYLFPEPEPGQAFDPHTQKSYHVLAEVWADRRWIAIDPLRGLVFHDEQGNLASLAEVVSNLAVIEQAYQDRPVLTYVNLWGEITEEPLNITAEYYRNAQRMNWGTIAKVPGAYESVRFVFGDRTGDIAVPLLLEQPHMLIALVFLTIGMALAGGACAVLQRTTTGQFRVQTRTGAVLVDTPD